MCSFYPCTIYPVWIHFDHLSPAGCLSAWACALCCCFVLLHSCCYWFCPVRLFPDQVHFIACIFFFLFPFRMMRTPLASSLVLSCDNPILAWRSPCFFISFIWLDIKAEKGYRWRYEPFQYVNYVIVQMTLYQYNWVLNYSFLSLPVQYVKL